MYSLNLKKSNLTNLKFLIPLVFIALLNVNCDHCDDEDLTREDEEEVITKHQELIVLNKK